MDIWILIPLVAIIGGFFYAYQEKKLKMKQVEQVNDKEVAELRTYIDKLKKRIENLEAIAAGEPEIFKTGAGQGLKEIEVEDSNSKKENQQGVSKISNDLRN